MTTISNHLVCHQNADDHTLLSNNTNNDNTVVVRDGENNKTQLSNRVPLYRYSPSKTKAGTTSCAIYYDQYLGTDSNDSLTSTTAFSSDHDDTAASSLSSRSIPQFESNVKNTSRYNKTLTSIRSVTDDLLGSLSFRSFRIRPSKLQITQPQLDKGSGINDAVCKDTQQHCHEDGCDDDGIVQDVPVPILPQTITEFAENTKASTEMIHLEIIPGVMAPFYGADETFACIESDSYTPFSCMGCDTFLFCINQASHAICPLCNTVSMNEMTSLTDHNDTDSTNHNISVGLGFTVEQLGKWQQSILDRRQSSPSSTPVLGA